MILLIDIGNSRIKACYAHNDELTHPIAIEHSQNDIELDVNVFSDKPERVFIVSVAGNTMTRKITDWCQSNWQMKPIIATVQSQFGDLVNAYTDLKQLGTDRWMAMIASRQATQNMSLTVSCGTATTLDIIDADGLHLGGMIIPGLHLMQSALIQNTQEIKPLHSDGLQPHDFLGQNTADCLTMGAVYSTISLIEYAYSKLRKRYAIEIDCFITGGFAERIIKASSIEYQHRPYHVLNGLNIWGKQF